MEDLGFSSAYRSNTSDGFGSEETLTFFHTKQESKKYHIDYLYLRSLEYSLVELGNYDDWIKLSDHFPLIVQCNNLY